MPAWRLAALLVLGCGLAACNMTATKPLYYYQNLDITAPRGTVIGVCHAYGCRMQTPYRMDADMRQIARLLAARPRTAQGERAAVRDIVAHMERRIGAAVGTSGDRAGNDLAGANDPGQQDCIDEAANTTSVLLVMQDAGLLRHHMVRKPEMRGLYIDGRWPHWTAVLVETASGEAWAVDSWFGANGAPPAVMPLRDWYAYEGPDESPGA